VTDTYNLVLERTPHNQENNSQEKREKPGRSPYKGRNPQDPLSLINQKENEIQ
jgi:hypothetical protein